MKPIGVTVKRDGEGGNRFSAFLVLDGGKLQRISPSWRREVREDRLQEFKVPLKEKGKTGLAKRLVAVVVGTKTVVGEPLQVATQRAERALRLLAMGREAEIVIPKGSA